MENKVCDGCKVADEFAKLDAALEIRENLLDMWQDVLDKRSEKVEELARVNRRVIVFNIAVSVMWLAWSLVRLFVG